MSRYYVDGKQPGKQVVFGFDQPLQQYFVDIVTAGKGERAIVGPLSTVYGDNTAAYDAITRHADMQKLNSDPVLAGAFSNLCGDLPC